MSDISKGIGLAGDTGRKPYPLTLVASKHLQTYMTSRYFINR
ncbi:MAG: hypothetical protein PHD01_10620 [Geobacteraceae bacterium]|nr:hypothetical protein [Geobacteraceae bacterium]